MPATGRPFPRLSNPHIRLNSDTEDLDLPETGATPLVPQVSSKSLARRSRLRREPHSSRSLYSLGDGTSAELLLPPAPAAGSRGAKKASGESGTVSWKHDDRSFDPERRARASTGNKPEVTTSYGAFLQADDSRTHSSHGQRKGRDGVVRSPQASASVGDSEDDINTQTVTAKFAIMPSAALLLYREDVEDDDWLHAPDADDRDRLCGQLFSRRGILNTIGLAMIVIGILTLFIGYPTLTLELESNNSSGTACSSSWECIAESLPLLQNVRTGLIDPDTPASAMRRTAWDGSKQVLVFSDEFNQDGRTFYPGDDPYFQAVDLWYGVTQDLEWYDPDAITTANGTLTIRFDAFQNHGLSYRSGMLQSWNQLCFKGGYVEASISLPGRGDTIGFWPGFWTMGNLGRPGYAATTDGMWPYSYWDNCDYGITKNQSQTDGASHLPGMRLPACTCTDADHPSPGKSRSAPEIDAIEASVIWLDPPIAGAVGTASQSVQVAPFDIWYQPNYDFVAIYDSSVTSMNSYRGGAFQQAVSGVTNLNNAWYANKAYQTYGFEYVPGASGYVTWFVGDRPTWTFDARAVGPNGNIGQRVIPEEPMALVANFGMSGGFAALNLTGIAPLLPATMRFDYVRIYQNEDGQSVTCDPEGYPSTEYIKAHPRAYEVWERTLWQETGYEWPKNSFVDGCKV